MKRSNQSPGKPGRFRAPDRGHCLWHRAALGLACRLQDCAAHSGLRQVRAQRWHLDAGGLRMGRQKRSIHLPGGPHPEAVSPQLLKFEQGTNRQGHGPTPRLERRLLGLSIQSQMLPQRQCTQDHPGRTRRRPPNRQGHRQDQAKRLLDETQKEGREALCLPQAYSRPGSTAITWPMRSKRQIPSRRHRPKPPQTGKDLSCTAANAQSLIRKALTLCSAHHFLRQQHIVFQQNPPRKDSRICQLPPTGETA